MVPASCVAAVTARQEISFAHYVVDAEAQALARAMDLMMSVFLPERCLKTGCMLRRRVCVVSSVKDILNVPLQW